MSEHKLIQIDVESVLRGKLGAKMRRVPRFVVKWLERLIRQDELNTILRANHPRRGAEFCAATLDYLDIDIKVTNPGKLPQPANRRLMIVSNHPLGGLDGIALIHLLSERYGNDIRFVVNDLLMAVEPLSEVFLPINKHGRQDRRAINDINEAMAGDGPVMVFPAGLVSRLGDDGRVRDLAWHKMFVMKAVQYERDVLPIYFSGHNSMSFYKLARWRKRLGIGFNIEMTRLPAEMLKSRGSSFTVTVGDIIPWQSLRTGAQAAEQAAAVRDIVYGLSVNS